MPNNIENEKAEELLKQFALKQLNLINDKIKNEGIETSKPILEYGIFSDKITQTAEKINANMIIIGAGEQLKGDVFILGANAEKIIKKSDKPVFVVKNEKLFNIKKIFCPVDFSAEEIDLISDATEPDLMVWKLWSMKESAYKADFRSSEKRKFNPGKFQCKMVTEAIGNVQYEGRIYKTNTLIAHNFIHTSAWQEECNVSISNPIIKTFNTQVSSAELYQSLLCVRKTTLIIFLLNLNLNTISMATPLRIPTP